MENVNSFCEQALLYYIKQIFPDAINSDKHLGMELDIFIPSLKVAIEYDGEAWHKTERKIKIDTEKNQCCLENGIELIRIREPKCHPIEGCTVFNREDSSSNLSLDIVITETLRYLSTTVSIDVDTKRDTAKIMEQYATKKLSNSLAYACPELAKEWHPIKNGNLTPDKVSKGTNRSVWWLGKCGHEWQMAVCERTREPSYSEGRIHKPQGCPYCAGRRVLTGFNDLQSNFPEIAKEWHPSKNGEFKPTKVSVKSKKKYWWLGLCGHEWMASPYARCIQLQRCPDCHRRKISPPVICVETGQKFDSGKEAAEAMNFKNTYSI